MSVKVNISDKEAASGEFVPIPSGLYHVVITDVEKKASKSDANMGKPMLYFTGTIQDGPYAEKTIGVNACLWGGAAYTIVGILKALGEYEKCKSKDGLTIPDEPEFYLGRDIMFRRGINPKTKKENPDDDPSSWIEVRGFAPYKAGDSSSSNASSGSNKSAAASSLLP
jgi:hypothetical protein